MLTDKIQTQAIQHLIDKTECEDWTLTKHKVVARECTVYQLWCPDYSSKIALKIYHDTQTSRQLQGQYSALERFSSSMNKINKQYQTPEPYGCFAEDNCFLMEWVSAPSLDKILWRYFYHAKRQQAAIHKTYAWLKHYHQASNPELLDINLEYYSKQLQRNIEKYKGDDLTNQKPIFTKAIETIKQSQAQFSALQSYYADAHGDFTPTNILIGEDKITGIDIGGGEKQVIENDMALMLNYIAIDFFNMLTHNDMQKSSNTWIILNIAFDAYEYPKDKKQRRFFLYVFLFQTLRRWLVINHRNLKKPTLLDKWRLRNSEIIVEGLLKILS